MFGQDDPEPSTTPPLFFPRISAIPVTRPDWCWEARARHAPQWLHYCSVQLNMLSVTNPTIAEFTAEFLSAKRLPENWDI